MFIIFVCLNLYHTRYHQVDLETFDLSDLDCKFDVILLDPPLEEYRHRPGVVPNQPFWTWDEVSIELLQRICKTFFVPHEKCMPFVNKRNEHSLIY